MDMGGPIDMVGGLGELLSLSHNLTMAVTPGHHTLDNMQTVQYANSLDSLDNMQTKKNCAVSRVLAGVAETTPTPLHCPESCNL